MTTAVVADVQLGADAEIPFSRLWRTELRKLTDTRANRWLLAVIVAVTPVVIVVSVLVAKPADLTYAKLLDYTQTPQNFLLPALGILAMTSEWSQRTGLVTFALVPDRRRVLLAKVAAIFALGLVVIAIAFPAAAIGNLLGQLRGGSASWASGAAETGEIIIVQLSGLVEGMAFGMAILVTAAAVVVYYVVPSLWSLLFSATKSLKSIAPWVDLNKAQSPLYTHDITGSGWLHVLSTAAIWILVPLIVGVVRVTRTDVKSS